MKFPLPQTHRDLFTLIMDLSRAVRCCQQDQTFCANLTFSQFSILNAIAERGRMKLADLHEVLAVEKSTTTRLVDPLTQQGLIVREKSDNDSRALILKLTPQGKEIYRKVWGCLAGFIEAVEMGIPKQERKSVYRATQIFLQALRKACNGPSCRTKKGFPRRES